MIKWLAVHLPRTWRIAILRGLAGDEFNITRDWLVSDPSRPGGLRVDQVALEDVPRLVAEAQLMMRLGAPIRPLAQYEIGG